MADAARIIGKITSTHPCTVPDCGGIAAMTLWRQEFIYQCEACGAGWRQDGQPIADEHVEDSDA